MNARSWVIYGLMAVGVVLRLVNFVGRPAFWGDEAALAMNIGPPAFLEMGRPFVLYQVCPFGFMALEKAVTSVVGHADFAFRIVPFVSGLALLIVVWRTARSIGDTVEGVVALGFTVFSFRLIQYSAELKPYQTDALIAAVLLWLGVRALQTPRPTRSMGLLIGAGILAPWFSLPSIFVLAGIGVALAFGAGRSRNTRELSRLVGVGLLWVASFATHFYIFFTSVADGGGMQRYWNDSFAPFPPTTLAALRWYPGHFFYFFEDPGGMNLRYLAGALWIAGAAMLAKKRRWGLLLCLCVPGLATVVASALHQYPMHPRLQLFLLPGAFVVMSFPLAALFRTRRPWARWFGILLVVALAVSAVPKIQSAVESPPKGRYVDQVVAHLVAHWQSEDRLYLEQETHWIYAWYAYRLDFKTDPIFGQARSHVGAESSFEPRWERDLVDFEPLMGAPRVWVVMPTYIHSNGSSRDTYFVQYLDKIGRMTESVDGVDVRLHRYDLTRTSTSVSK